MRKNQKIYLLFVLSLSWLYPSYGCTVVSAIDKYGQVWNLNNEDGPFGIANFLNVFPKSKDTKYGYYTLSYLSPKLGTGGNIQGGMNEMGLTFDFNAIDLVEDFDPTSKQAFPKGDDQILPHILSNMSTVQEVVDFFSTYWFQNGFRSAQMHVADRQGTFAIISASGIKVQPKGEPLVSTNFDICGGEESGSCWRYPIAVLKLEQEEINLISMISIALETRQKKGLTMYTNIQNLSTGAIWLFSQHDPNNMISTNISTLLAKGQRSYTFSDLSSINEDRPPYHWEVPEVMAVDQNTIQKFEGTYHNSFVGKVIVEAHETGLKITFADGNVAIFQPKSKHEYVLLDSDVKVKFLFDEKAKSNAMSLYENGVWAFKAWWSS